MFTGLVEEPCRVTGARPRADGGLDLDVDLGALAKGLRLGDSVALSGVCLTVVRFLGSLATFELSPETLARTRLGAVSVGSRLNVERALRAGGRLGGHIVQGHVDGLGAVERLARQGEWVELDVRLPAALARYCVEKGSIALDGVSLTVARLADRSDGTAIVSIALIPHTLDRTSLGDARPGDPIHVEVDILAKYVERLAAPYAAR